MLNVKNNGINDAIIFENVRKTFPRTLREAQKICLHSFSFKHPKHKTLGVIGANGAGKSTSLKLLMNFIRPDEGRISILGQPPDTHTLRRHVGYLPELASFPPSLTILDMLSFTGRACGLEKKTIKDRSRRLLETLDLWDDRNRQLKKYSKGMQQRANFAVALINNPELLILDEPMSGLDPIGRNLISKLILKLKEDNVTILFCSHILEDVDRIADLILVLHKGQKMYFGTPIDFIKLTGKKSLSDAYICMIDGDIDELQP